MPDNDTNDFNPWKDPCIFIHAHEDTYKAICAVINTLKEQGQEAPDVGVLLNPFGHAMIFIIDMRGIDERIEAIFLNNVPTAMKPTFQPMTTDQKVQDHRPLPWPKKPDWLN